MPNQIVVSNFLLLDRANSARVKLNSGSRLRLYKSLITPSPGDTLAVYTPSECNFDTYSIQHLDPNWQAPLLITPGEYQTLSAVLSYNSPTVTGNTIYGLFVDDGSGGLLFAMLFDSPINFTVGAPALSIQIGYQVWAKAIIP